jgi:DNA-binding MarR family transcriptional regulator
MVDQIDITVISHAIQRCACVNVRQTDRVITQFYDEYLARSGLNTPQFALLATIARIAPVTIHRLADIMTLDRTTLTRNLHLLSKGHLIRDEEGEDRRMRLVLLTREGEQALVRTWPMWQEAQARVEQALGSERFETLLTELSSLRAVAR